MSNSFLVQWPAQCKCAIARWRGGVEGIASLKITLLWECLHCCIFHFMNVFECDSIHQKRDATTQFPSWCTLCHLVNILLALWYLALPKLNVLSVVTHPVEKFTSTYIPCLQLILLVVILISYANIIAHIMQWVLPT